MAQPKPTKTNSITRLFTAAGRQEAWSFLWSHRYSFAISLAVTLIGLAIFYAMVWRGGRPGSGFLDSGLIFLENVEARSLDARFAIRGSVQPTPEVVIVAIDQKTIDSLGWPFPRSNYGRMLNTLTRDGAKVVGFDVAFPFPDRTSTNIFSTLEEEYQRIRGGEAKDAFWQRMQELREESDSDGKFADAMLEANNVVLGHVFLNNPAEIEHLDQQRIQEYAEVLVFQAYPQLRWTVNTKDEDKTSGFDPSDAIRNYVAVEPNLRAFADVARSYGAFNFEADSDGTYRQAPLIFEYIDPALPPGENVAFYPSLDVEVARFYLGAELDDTKVFFNQNGLDQIELGERRIFPDVHGKVLINFAGPAQTYPYVSFSDVANGLTPEGMFRDRIVLVGATAVAIGDIRPTPFEKGFYPGVEIHANVLDNILHDSFLKRGFEEQMVDLLVLLFCGLVMGFLFVVTRPVVSAELFFLALTMVLGFVYYGFVVEGRWLWLVLPVTTLAFNYLGIASYRVLFEEKEKRKVRGAFGQYVAPGFINQLLKEPGKLQLGGEEVELTIMFSDIRGFTSISEGLTPTELTELLNEYLTAMTEVVFKNRGTLDKYIGDAVMAFWGRPFLGMHNHAELACQAALEMSDKLKELNRGWEERGRPPIKIGIGLNTGPVMVGNMGSARRFNYTVMGDHVNLGSRLEGLTKEYGAQIILSEFTYAQVKSQFVTRELDLIRVKGKNKPVAIYQLLGAVSEQERYQDLLTDFSAALTAYKRGNWDTAHEMFEAIAEKHPSDGPTKLFLNRCQHFRREAPEGVWEGVYTMTTK